jgi:hypothetical protein
MCRLRATGFTLNLWVGSQVETENRDSASAITSKLMFEILPFLSILVNPDHITGFWLY